MRPRSSPHLRLLRAAAALLVAAGTAAGAQNAERATFVVRHRADTLAVERVTRTGRRLESALTGRDGTERTVAELTPAALYSHLDYRAGDSTSGGVHMTLDFGPDTIVARVEGRPGVQRFAARGALTRLNQSVALLEQMVRRASAVGGDAAEIPLLVENGETTRATVTRPHPDSATIAFPAVESLGRPATVLRLRVDRDGRVLGGGIPERNLVIERVAGIAPPPAGAVPPATVARSAAEPAPVVTLPGTQIRTLTSRATGTTYDLYVSVPGDAAANPGRRYPVVYLLDGQWDFKLLLAIHAGLRYDGVVPDLIIVGITYHGDDVDYDARRAVDLTPVPDPGHPGSGGAPKFHAFLERELLPYVESRYPADSARRVLLGSSFGGLFGLYALLTRPTLFSGYVVGSPSVTYGERAAFALERAYAASHRELPARVYLAVGGIEGLATPVAEFARVLRERRYQGLELETHVVAGERHSGNRPEGFNRGLRFLFETPGW
jgi:hypothetical protein